jgi:putative flippase GtrA
LGLGSVVAPTFLGFCLINGLSFGVDLAILMGLHGGLGLPVPIAVTAAYACAFALSYVLNRTFNFQSHAPVGPQVAIYVVVVVVNYPGFHPRGVHWVGGHRSALPVVANRGRHL